MRARVQCDTCVDAASFPRIPQLASCAILGRNNAVCVRGARARRNSVHACRRTVPCKDRIPCRGNAHTCNVINARNFTNAMSYMRATV